MVDDIDLEMEPESVSESAGRESESTPGDSPATEASEAERRGPGAGVWVAIAVAVVVLVVAAAAIGYLVGRGNDDSGATATSGTTDTARTDQTLCAGLLEALQGVAAAANPTDQTALAGSFRTNLAGLLSDSPPSAVTSATQDAYDAAMDLAAGTDPTAAAAYAEKLEIAKYQCAKIATWDWPAT